MSSLLINELKQHAAFNHEQVEIINHAAREKWYQKGDYFLQAPKVCTELGFVLEGVFRYYTINAEGNEVSSMFIQEKDFFTDLRSFHKEAPSEGFIQAETEARILVFDKATFQNLTARIEGWGHALRSISQERLESQLKLSRQIVELDAASAYRFFITHFPNIASRVPDGHLASFLGITKYTFSRVKKEVEKNLP